MPIQKPGACRILVAHEEPIAAAGLLAALRWEPGFQPVDALATGGESAEPFQVVIADHRTAMELLAQAPLHRLPRSVSSAGVIVLSGRLQAADVRRAIRAGAAGYLQLGCSFDELRLGVKTVALGSRYLCRLASGQMADSVLDVALTSREDEVLRQLIRGDCNKSIAKELGIALGTVKTHMRSIMAKLNARTRNEASSIARSRGLVDEPMPVRAGSDGDPWRAVLRTGAGQGPRPAIQAWQAHASPCAADTSSLRMPHSCAECG